MARTTSCILALVVGLTTATARAETRSSHDEATRLFEQGERAYGEGRFAEAADLVRRAYELQPEPILLFNIGRALEGQGDIDGAIESYAQYLDAAPHAENRGLVERRLQVLREQQQQAAAMQQELREAEARLREAEENGASTSWANEETSRRSVNPVPWVIMGVGLASIVVGGALGALALDRQDRADEEPVQRSAYDTLEEGRRFALSANITLAAGGAVAAAGLIWGLIDLLTRPRRHTEEDTSAFRLRPAPLAICLSR